MNADPRQTAMALGPAPLPNDPAEPLATVDYRTWNLGTPVRARDVLKRCPRCEKPGHRKAASGGAVAYVHVVEFRKGKRYGNTRLRPTVACKWTAQETFDFEKERGCTP